jgi:spectinomycin phosphotransferase/16S rRNA (guanine(1405)-N(7))-methyltransferase
VLNAPSDLPDGDLVEALADGWGLSAATVGYRPLGFGSHHWEVVDAAGTRWFVTVDDLETRRSTHTESLDAAFLRLQACLTVAYRLRESGRTFVVAPVRGVDGALLRWIGNRFAVAVFPFVVGESFSWGEFGPPQRRRALLDLVVGVHATPVELAQTAIADDFVIAHRDLLEAIVDGADVAAVGPYTRPAVGLLTGHAPAVRRLLARYDALVAVARTAPTVLTHGEPHPGNLMRTATGWVLIDWDTVRIAPPERDLWGLSVADPSLLEAYTVATGFVPDPARLELYRIRWEIMDLAACAHEFSRPHTGTANDEQSWRILSGLVDGLATS